jgi:hypothetical protein
VGNQHVYTIVESFESIFTEAESVMRRGSIFVILFILLAAVVIGASQFLRSQPPIEITIAVDPLAEAWVSSSIQGLNATNPIVNATTRVQYRVLPIDDLDVWNGSNRWNSQNHPAAWIAASSTSAAYAKDIGLSLVDVTPSLARTPLVWGGYVSRVNVATGEGNNLFDWDAIQAAAAAESWSAIGGQADWRFVKLGFAAPNRKISGLAVLYTGAADFSGDPALTGPSIRGANFRTWMEPVLDSVPNFATLGSDPAAAMTRGASTMEIGLLPESQWLNNLSGLLKNEDVVFSYPAFQFMLDFPLLRWSDSTTTVEQQQAVDLLRNWLTGAAQQATLPNFGLRPANSEPTPEAALFAAAIPYGIQLTPDYGQAVTAPPTRGDTQGLIEWAASNQ